MTEQESTEPKKEQFEKSLLPAKDGKEKIIVGYIFSTLGGIFGCYIGLHLYYSKRTLPSGEKTYTYNEQARKHAGNMFIVAGLCTLIWTIINLYPYFFV